MVEVRTIQPPELEAARHLLAANGRDRRVADAGEFCELVGRRDR